jgi:hypothetical protein
MVRSGFDERFVERRARDERSAIVKLVNERRDPASLRSEIAAGSVAFLRAAYGGRKKASSTDLITAGAASVAAICRAMQKQGDTFARDVRILEGLPTTGLPGRGSSVRCPWRQAWLIPHPGRRRARPTRGPCSRRRAPRC